MKDLIKHLKFMIRASNDCEVDNKIQQLIIDYIEQVKTKEQLLINGVGSSNSVDYKQGFELAQNYINESPCDPDIYKTQLEAWDKYQQFLIDNNII